MKEQLKSEALEVNLAETRKVKFTIPDKYKAFIELSKSHWGIHKRTEECIKEIYHPYSNYSFVVDELRKIVLKDFWFYITLDCAEEAFLVLTDIFRDLFHKKIKVNLKEQLVRTILEFIELICESNVVYKSVVIELLNVLNKSIENNKECFIHSSVYFKKHTVIVSKIPEFKEMLFSLTKKVFEYNIAFWEDTSKIEKWYKEKESLFEHDYTEAVSEFGKQYYKKLKKELEQAKSSEDIVEKIPSFNDIANSFRYFSNKFETFREKFYYTFYILHLEGLDNLKDRIIGDINNLLKNVINEIELNQIFQYIDKIFVLFKEFKKEHISAILDCISTLGKKIIELDDSEDKFRVNYFEKKLIDFGFETPGVVYMKDNWQMQVNQNHIKNIRVWLELIETASSIPVKLLSSLIVNLRLGGIYISDTDLFQRDVTKILNSNIVPHFQKVKQLTRIFPVYFNEIGAEGDIRKVTTTMDELSHRNDKLLHFLRKQVHVESNNTLIDIVKKVFNFWYDGDLNTLKRFLPQDVYESIDINGRWYAPVHKMVNDLCKKYKCRPEKFLEFEKEKLDAILEKYPSNNELDKKRFKCVCNLYVLLREKYSFDTINILSVLSKYNFFKPEEINVLRNSLDHKDYHKSLKIVYQYIEKLNNIIFSSDITDGWENIYHKRHIAFGIPSMYGMYREVKFEALGHVFRLERVASRLMEKIIEEIYLDYISAKTLNQIYTVLEYFKQGMKLDGIVNQGFDSNLQMFKYSLTSASFSLSQYHNIFQFMAVSIKEIINKYFIRSYEYSLGVVIPQIFKIDKKALEKEKRTLIIKKSEEFYRDIISNAFLLKALDNFISNILNSLNNMVDNFTPEIINDVMSYNSNLIINPFNKENLLTDNQIFLGSKAFFLKKLYLAGFPVPPGFVLTTEVFRRRKAVAFHSYLSQEMDALIKKQIKRIEKITGKQFGNPKNPLLFSVRSGGVISMPGAMDTFLNVGMNEEIAENLSKQKCYAWCAWDCYRRLLQSWGMSMGIHRDVFDKIISDYKLKYNVKKKINLKPEQIKTIAHAYKNVLKQHNIKFEEDVFLQLKKTISIVLDSWSSKRARVYREYLQIADEWGTAVIIQKMILGNLYETSGTGVVFTHNPNRHRPGVHLYGDFTLCGQGEDIVSGLVHALPIGKTQRKQLKLEGTSLQEAFPLIYKKVYRIAKEMTENHGFSHQEIEFTFESENPDDLYILQTRDQNIRENTNIDVFSSLLKNMIRVGRGIGIGGGALNGILTFDMEDLKYFAEKYPEKNLILVRPDTVPDDIGMIFECAGLLTAKGGATSHAAVTAVRLGKVCVVNCRELLVYETKKECSINGHIFKAGDEIAIDGSLGNIYKGNYSIENTEILYDKLNKKEY
ncbi:MAG: pyruvate phosphate dikinase [Bacteroidetes bacterium]|nr:pyruvate phosphate dikinase [Bacteroidota bacterium]